jgi:hypothetical protein
VVHLNRKRFGAESNFISVSAGIGETDGTLEGSRPKAEREQDETCLVVVDRLTSMGYRTGIGWTEDPTPPPRKD